MACGNWNWDDDDDDEEVGYDLGKGSLINCVVVGKLCLSIFIVKWCNVIRIVSFHFFSSYLFFYLFIIIVIILLQRNKGNWRDLTMYTLTS